MASTALLTPRAVATPTAAGKSSADPRPGFLVRFMLYLAASRQRQADRGAADFIEMNGGKITDSIERQIERRFLP